MRELRIGLLSDPVIGSHARFAEAIAARARLVVINPNEILLALDGRGPTLVDPPGVALDALDGFFSLFEVSGAAATAAALGLLEARLPHLNGLAALRVSADKFATALALAAAGIGHPHTILVENGDFPGALEARARAAETIGYPLVAKSPRGSNGRNVALVRTAADLEPTVHTVAPRPGEGVLLQAFLAGSAGRDTRVIVLGDRVLAVQDRWTTQPGEFRSGLDDYHYGPGRLTPQEEALSVAAVAAVGLDFAGIDLTRTADGPMILETNAHPQITDIEAMSGLDLAGPVVELLLERMRG